MVDLLKVSKPSPVSYAPSKAENSSRWVICQIGAREHYAVARSIARRDALEALVTDAWVRPNSFLRGFDLRLDGRFHAELSEKLVIAPTWAALRRDGLNRLLRKSQTSTDLSRNAWFQRVSVKALERVARDGRRPVIFAYSYAARDIFAFAKLQGWITILGQIDPGPAEARIVRNLFEKYAPQLPNPAEKPPRYWDLWREETELADHVVVNSDWSRCALEENGVSSSKITVIPLAYEPEGFRSTTRQAVVRFDSKRRLRVLFLGQIILRKGIWELAGAARRLAGAPVEFHLVGAAAPGTETFFRGLDNVILHGPKPRSAAADFYRRCDLFILPTHSDGFAITQWEAIAAGCPVVASRHCGSVVENGRNGILLREVSEEAIYEAIQRVLDEPGLLANLIQGANTTKITKLEDIGVSLSSLITSQKLGAT